MYDREEEEELHPTDRSEMSDTDSDSAAASFVFSVQNYFKTTPKTEVVKRGGGAPQDSRCRFCKYCGKGFVSSKALYGHLRIHRQYRDRSKTETRHIKTQTKPSPQEDKECGFGCFICKESFSSIQLLCRHMGIHRETVSNGVRKQPTMSQESNLSSAKTTVKPEKDIPCWLKETGSDDAVPLRVHYGPAHPHMETRKKRKVEEISMANRDTSTEGVADSERAVEHGSKSRSGIGRRSMNKKAKVMNSLHPCEICGKTFTTGQALGGHKTYHRVKDPSKVEFVQLQPKTKQESFVTTAMLPGSLPEDAYLSDEARPKKMLGIDLNIPYVE
ncbi:hypothetical protein HRI_001830800 [Hibiscus trionum]|uniref:C2H2-type domain-containing protein n=1 Tax=Hibiscus trionum TaxID=183268 RepID=A0A9W7HPB9_HIBTR|nr:hypothetical protein HRI_001830800 [Hibiscus trionum]